MLKSKLILFILLLVLYQSATFFLLGGNVLKNFAVLFSGLMVSYIALYRIKLSALNVVLLLFSAALIFFFHFNHAHPINGSVFQQYLFILLNLALFIVGNASSGKWEMLQISRWQWIMIFTIVTLSNARILYEYQFGTSVIQDRHLGQEGVLNAIGLSHTKVVIIFLLLSYVKNRHIKGTFVMRIFWIVSLVSSIVVVLKTGSRGPVIIGLAVYLFFNFQFRNLKIIKSFVYLIPMFLVLFQFTSIELDVTRIQRLFSGDLSDDRSSLERLEMYRLAWKNKDAVFIGLKGYRPFPHNILIEGFYRAGVFFFPIIFILTKAVQKAVTLRKSSNSMMRFYACAFLYLLAQSMISLNLDNNRGLWLFMGIILSHNIYRGRINSKNLIKI